VLAGAVFSGDAVSGPTRAPRPITVTAGGLIYQIAAYVADTLAAVRQHYWQHTSFRVSAREKLVAKLSSTLRECLTYALCRAA
jgi:hypothetical protein